MDEPITVGDAVLFRTRRGGSKAVERTGIISRMDYLAVCIVLESTPCGRVSHIVWKHDIIHKIAPDAASMAIAKRKGKS